METTQNKRPKPKPIPKPRLKAKLQPKPKQSRARANYRHMRCISSLLKTKQGEPKAGTKVKQKQNKQTIPCWIGGVFLGRGRGGET